MARTHAMTARFMLTIAGPYRVDLIKDLAERTAAAGGSWLINRAMHLEGRFAAIIKVEVPTDRLEALQTELRAMPGYYVAFAEAGEPGAANTYAVAFSLRARNRTGLTREIARVFDDRGIVTEDVETHRLAVAGIGESVFTSKVIARIPEGIDLEGLRAELEAVDQGMVVEMERETG